MSLQGTVAKPPSLETMNPLPVERTVADYIDPIIVDLLRIQVGSQVSKIPKQTISLLQNN